MINDDVILSEMKGVIHEALNRVADSYIDEAVEEFEQTLRKQKNETILSILNEIEMSVSFNPQRLSNDIHIVFKGGTK